MTFAKVRYIPVLTSTNQSFHDIHQSINRVAPYHATTLVLYPLDSTSTASPDFLFPSRRNLSTSEPRRVEPVCVPGGEVSADDRQEERDNNNGRYQRSESGRRGISELFASFEVRLVNRQEDVVFQRAVTPTESRVRPVVHARLQFVVVAFSSRPWATLPIATGLHAPVEV